METTNRHEWEFEYTAANLASAAETKRNYHKKRFEAWEAKKAETMEKVKSSGLTIHEGVMGSAYNNTNALTSQPGAMVMVDATLQKDLNECTAKIGAHRTLAADYDSWLQFLDANPEARLKLKQQDWMFFFGKL